MKVAAIVPHYNRKDLLETLLPSLLRQTHRFDQIIVVDNGSTDGSADFAESRGATVQRLERNFGFAVAVNWGLSLANTEWVAILNNDVVLRPDWLEKLLFAADRRNASFATGKILSAADLKIIDGTFDEIACSGCACRCGSGLPDSEVWQRPHPTRIAPMTAALFRTEVFQQLGPLDERFQSYLEDIDLGLRCMAHGYVGIYEPEAVAVHVGSATWGRWSSDSVRLLARNQVLLAAKHLWDFPLFPIVAGQLLWGLVALRHGRFLSYCEGKLAGWKLAPSMRPASAYTEEGTAEFRLARRRFRERVEESEREISKLQRKTRFDHYWRAYFWLRPW